MSTELSQEKINNIEWEHIVVSIPKNTVHMIVQTSIFNDGKIDTYRAEYNLDALNECRDILEKYIEGELPLYVVTEKGWEHGSI